MGTSMVACGLSHPHSACSVLIGGMVSGWLEVADKQRLAPAALPVSLTMTCRAPLGAG
jgi:hypothetical protein